MIEVLNDTDFEKFRKLIYEESGIIYTSINRSILDSRIKDLIRTKNIPTPSEYYDLVTKSPEEMKMMLDSITTNLTRFFRNQPHFDTLINYIIPHLVESKKTSIDKKVRIWSAGCSTGEEPYTIAMILKEKLPFGYDFQVTASDISLKSLLVAQKGFYETSKVQGIPPEYLDKYFIKYDTGYQMKQEIIEKIRFDYHNLKNDSGARNLDIVFCRNVLIYFDEQAQLAVINRFWNSMAPKSYLFIGHSESLFGMKTNFEFLKTDWSCLYQKNINK